MYIKENCNDINSIGLGGYLNLRYCVFERNEIWFYILLTIVLVKQGLTYLDCSFFERLSIILSHKINSNSSSFPYTNFCVVFSNFIFISFSTASISQFAAFVVELTYFF
jgi:hypothetical protein